MGAIASRSRTILAAAGVAAAAVLLAWVFLGNRGAPAAAVGDGADGDYWHDCCGTIELRRGELVLEGAERVSYTIAKDGAGHYLLPDTYVGTWEHRGFEVDGSRPPLKLRLDKFPKPERVVLPAASGSYSFKREVKRR